MASCERIYCRVPSKMGSLKVIVGPMFASKSTALLQELSSCAALGLKTLYINHSLDTRNTADIFSTHSQILKSKITGETSIVTTRVSCLADVDVAAYDVIGVDEAQFFEDLVSNVVGWVDAHEKKVVVVGLDGDFKRDTIGHILELIPKADTVEKLHAYCQGCAQTQQIEAAPFTHRVAPSTDSIVVGGGEAYIPLCRACFLRREASEIPKDPHSKPDPMAINYIV